MSLILGLIIVVTFSVSAEILAGSNEPRPPVILTLDACIAEALQNNTDLNSLLDSRFISHERIREAKRKRWPTLSATLTDISSIGGSKAYSSYDPSSNQQLVPGEGFQSSADLSVPLYDSGARQSSIRLEQESLSLIDTAILQARQDIVYQIITLYLSVLERQAEVEVRTEQLAKAQESLNVAKGRLQSGASIEYEVLLEEAYFAQAQADLLSTVYALNNARRTLLLAMRRDIEATIDLVPLQSDDAIVDISESALVETAVANRMEFHRYRAEIDSYRQQMKLLKATRYPNLDFIASYSQQGDDFDAMRHADIAWSAGLSLRFSPFRDVTVHGSTSRNWVGSSDFMQRNSLSAVLNDGSSTRSRETEINVTLQKLQTELTYLKDIIGAEALNAWEMYQGSRAILQARQKNVVAMEENERIQLKYYELGLNQYKDMVDARAERVTARIALNRATYSMEHCRMNLEYVLGLLGYQE